MTVRPWIIDSNIALDLWLFENAAVISSIAALKASVGANEGISEGVNADVRFFATPVMRSELEAVLKYTHLQPYFKRENTAQSVLQNWDAFVTLTDTAPYCGAKCKDIDDQMFVDLACQLRASHGSANLISRDRHLLKMRRKLAKQGVQILSPDTLHLLRSL